MKRMVLPALFDVFTGGAHGTSESKHPSGDTSLQLSVYGHANSPLFLASDVGRVFDVDASVVYEQVLTWDGIYKCSTTTPIYICGCLYNVCFV